jgi:hypothetical protein
MDVPGNSVAAAIDVVLDFAVIGDFSGNLKRSFEHNGGRVHDGSVSLPKVTKDADTNAQLDWKAQRSLHRQLTIGLSLVDELRRKTIGMAVPGVQQVKHDIDVVPLHTSANEQSTRCFDTNSSFHPHADERSDFNEVSNVETADGNLCQLFLPLLLVLDEGLHTEVESGLECSIKPSLDLVDFIEGKIPRGPGTDLSPDSGRAAKATLNTVKGKTIVEVPLREVGDV